jgi:hypothetical protein
VSEPAAKKRKRTRAKKTKKGREDVKAMRKTNTPSSQAGVSNKRKAVPDESSPEK